MLWLNTNRSVVVYSRFFRISFRSVVCLSECATAVCTCRVHTLVFKTGVHGFAHTYAPLTPRLRSILPRRRWQERPAPTSFLKPWKDRGGTVSKPGPSCLKADRRLGGGPRVCWSFQHMM